MKKSILFTLVLAILISCTPKTNDENLENNQELLETANNSKNEFSQDKINDQAKDEAVYNLKNEVFNHGLKKGLKENIIIEKLGTKYSDSLFFSEVSGLDSKTLKYNHEGLVLWFEKNNKDFYLTQIEIKQNKAWKTSKGISIGDDVKKVQDFYQNYINSAESYEEAVIVGDVYEGLFFIIEKNKVKEIILGSLAE
jgi:hypothetical protein